MIARSRVEKKNQGRMLFEVQLLRSIDHPHIIRIFEFFTDDKNFYLITEYCEGGDIFSMIQKASSFSERTAIRIMKQVINAVLYCHLNGIVHRDIKSDNILFLKNDINSPIKLIDFGISVKFEKDTKLKEKTGTVLYIAPEVISGDYDEKCDIWSCGVLLYMMLCGQPPFNGSTRREVMMKIKKGSFSFKAKIWTLITAEAKDLITQMLTMDPDKRPSCRQVLSHPWFLRDQDIKINSMAYLENMKKFEVHSQLMQAILTFISTNIIQHEDTRELETLFKSLDVDHDGKLSKAEIEEGYRQAYPQYDTATIKRFVENIFEQADGNHSGQIDYTEYLISAMDKTKLMSKDKLEKAFHSFDLNGDGSITKDEWEKCLGGIKLTDIDWKNFLEEVDSNKDGSISLQEFMTFVEQRCRA